MAQRWYQKASVQAALVAGTFLLLTAIVAALLGSILSSDHQTEVGVRSDEDRPHEAGNTVLRDSDSGGPNSHTGSVGTVQDSPTEPPAELDSTIPKTSSRPKGCLAVDLVRGDGSVLQGAEMTCGPKDAGFLTTSDATFRFTQSLEEIAEGVFPERLLSFDKLQRLDFQPLSDAESEAARRYHAARSDFFNRLWRRAAVTFLDGTVWEPVYVYDKCTFRSRLEDGDLDALKPISLLFAQTTECN
jgi:hypothetical protein